MTILLKRAGMLYCADCTPIRYKVLKSRDQLPFLDSPDAELIQGPRRFNLSDALLLRLTLDLIGQDVRQNPLLTGLTASTATSIISNVQSFAIDRLYKPSEDYWVGQIVYRDSISDEPGWIEYSTWYFDAASAVPNWIDREIAGSQNKSAVRMHLVSVQRAADFVATRAIEAGLLEGDKLGSRML